MPGVGDVRGYYYFRPWDTPFYEDWNYLGSRNWHKGDGTPWPEFGEKENTRQTWRDGSFDANPPEIRLIGGAPCIGGDAPEIGTRILALGVNRLCWDQLDQTIVGELSAEAGLAAAFDWNRAILGELSAEAGLAAAFAYARFFAGELGAEAGLAAAFAYARFFAGELGAEAGLAAAFDWNRALPGALGAEAGLAAAIRYARQFAGTIGAQGGLASSFAYARSLPGTIGAQGGLAASLSSKGTLYFPNNIARGTCTVASLSLSNQTTAPGGTSVITTTATAMTEVATWDINDANNYTGTWSTSMNVTGLTAATNYRWRMQSMSAGGCVLHNSSAYSGTFSATGVNVANLLLTWGPSDRVRLSLEMMHVGPGTSTMTLTYGVSTHFQRIT